MTSHLGNHFRKTRLTRGLTRGQLARHVYQNISKGARRISNFEKTGRAKGDLLTKLASVLEIDNKVIEELLDADRRAYQEFLSEPIKPHIVVRLLAVVYLRVDLPADIDSLDEAEEYTVRFARRHRLRVCLVWTRRTSIYFATDGSFEQVMEAAPAPVMKIGGKECLLEIIGFSGVEED